VPKLQEMSGQIPRNLLIEVE